MNELMVELGARAYPIRIGATVEDVLGRVECGAVLLVSDSHVGPLHAEAVRGVLEAQGCRVHLVVVPAGETSKSMAMVESLCGEAVAAGLDRHDCVVALGGGVVGDLAGFVAATYLRGVQFIQMPTSLLAMVDSSVGGKTGVNLKAGKNLVGAFYQPQQVAMALDLLETLPEREYVSGLAEVVKHGVIHDGAFFADLERQAAGILARDREIVAQMVATNCRIKADVVARDEREGGLRAILNFGHTLGHALETVCGYGVFLHGEALAIGAASAVALSTRFAGLPATDAARVIALLEAFKLPTSLPEGVEVTWEQLLPVMQSDKKARAGEIKWVLAESMGHAAFGCAIPEDAVREAAAEVGVV
jgi:3-dehydroquinate synthase